MCLNASRRLATKTPHTVCLTFRFSLYTYALRCFLQDLKDVLAKKIAKVQPEVLEFRKKYGSSKVGEVTVEMV